VFLLRQTNTPAITRQANCYVVLKEWRPAEAPSNSKKFWFFFKKEHLASLRTQQTLAAPLSISDIPHRRQLPQRANARVQHWPGFG
jgi:hypothetical protein